MAKKGKGDLTASKAAAKAAKRAKQESKAARAETRKSTKSAVNNGNSTGGGKGKSGKGKGGKKGAVKEEEEEDLDTLLKRFRESWENEHKTTEERVGEAPSRRANATLTSCPLGTDLYLFGGEYFDGDRATFFADLYRYTPSTGAPAAGANGSAVESSDVVDHGTWRSYSSPTQPGPRSAHQVAATAANGGQLWLFGGEFAGVRMTSFHHYRDLWVFHIATKQWERIDTKVRPSARSGHRMAFWKHFLVLFGGFQDTGARTTYLGDLWLFDTSEYKWHEIKQINELRKPSSRSGFSLLPCADGLILHGGYCKRYVKGQRTQGVALEDTWMLKLTLGEDGDLFHSGSIEWQRRRKIGYAPGPRSGCTMSLWANRNMGVLFGGVVDTETDEESLESQCFNDLYAYQIPGNGRWISLNLRKPKKKAGAARRRKKAAAVQPSKQDSERYNTDDEDEEGDKEPETIEEEEEDPDDPQKSVPIPRYNVMLAVQRNVLYAYGGIHETADREYTMDDFHTLDLSKMDRFACLKKCPIDSLEWNESSSESGSDDEDDDGSDSDTGSEGGAGRRRAREEHEEEIPEGEEARDETIDEDDYAPLLEESLDDETLAMLKREREEREELRKKTQAFLGVSKEANRSEADVLSTPLPGEALRDFYARSKSYWASMVHEQTHGQIRGKEMRRDGFELAEKRYLELKPVLEEIQRIQREAGLDDEEMRAASAGKGGAAGGTGVDSRNRR